MSTIVHVRWVGSKSNVHVDKNPKSKTNKKKTWCKRIIEKTMSSFCLHSVILPLLWTVSFGLCISCIMWVLATTLYFWSTYQVFTGFYCSLHINVELSEEMLFMVIFFKSSECLQSALFVYLNLSQSKTSCLTSKHFVEKKL